MRVERQVPRPAIAHRHGSPPAGAHVRMTPSSRPTVANASSARSSCSRACAAVTIVPDPREVQRDGREHDRLREDALVHQSIAEAHRGLRVAHHHRGDGGLGTARVEAQAPQFGLEVARVVPQPRMQLGLVHHHPDRLAAGRHDGRRVRRREQERPRALGEDLAQRRGARDVAAQHADGLAECPDLDRHAPVQAEMVDRAPSVPAEDAGGMGVVDEHRRACRLGRLDDPGEWRDVAVHAEHAIGDDEDQPVGLAAPRAPVADRLVEDAAERLDVGVGIDLARRLREPHPVDDRGVVEAVADDQVGLAGDRRDDPGVRA